MKATTLFSILAAMALGNTSAALAQSANAPVKTGFFNVDIGAQPMRRSITASSTFSVYDETATVESAQRIRNGSVFDISAGYRVWNNLAVGAGFSSFGRSGTGTLTATIPHPVFYDRRVTTARDVDDLEHTERTVHVRVTLFTPVSERLDFSVSAGPSFIKVTQGVATSVTLQTGTQNFTVDRRTESGTAFGFNGGADVNYKVIPSAAIGLFVRYVGGQVDLPSVADFSVGGVQTGVGLRVRF